ncbi:MAG: HEPN domain-containing protein [Bacteroidetes bacterium]|nr:HEPN domain-containing protein [Bacteroidota bacterium]
MSVDRKWVREITGYTHDRVTSDPENWMSNASLFKNAADLIASQNNDYPPLPFYFNAGLSIELGLKAIAVAKSNDFPKTHNLNKLVKSSGIEITSDQEATLELLSEFIIWAGRYPTPNDKDAWDKYNDETLEKHKIISKKGNGGSVSVNPVRFPTLENYHCIWGIINAAYENDLQGNA